jgi:hypothetical protein
MNIRLSSFRYVFPFAALALVACGGSSSSPSDQGSSGSGSGSATSTSPTDPNPPAPDASPCVKATHELCVQACACNKSGSGKCVIAYGGGVVTEEHDSLADCENFYALFACAQPGAEAYNATCETALQGAACVTTKEKGDALDFPAACKSPTK